MIQQIHANSIALILARQEEIQLNDIGPQAFRALGRKMFEQSQEHIFPFFKKYHKSELSGGPGFGGGGEIAWFHLKRSELSWMLLIPS